jgi:Na+/proline symporter
VQRLLASKQLADARKALITSGVVIIFQFAMFLTIGVGLWAYYNGQKFDVADSVFPKFIIEVMPPGMTGLVIAALLAAAMSTVSGALNSLSAATTHDIYLPLKGRPQNDPSAFKAARVFTLMWAAILIGGALLYRQQGTPVVVIALAIASFTYGGLLGAFAQWDAGRHHGDDIRGLREQPESPVPLPRTAGRHRLALVRPDRHYDHLCRRCIVLFHRREAR